MQPFALDELPVGAIVPYAGPLHGDRGADDRTGGWPPPAAQGYLRCDGSALEVARFPELHAAIGYVYGGSGGTFHLPDLQGVFLRGYETEGRRDHEHDRAIGSYQEDTFQDHEHAEPVTKGQVTLGEDGTMPVMVPGSETDTNEVVSGRTSDETVPKNVCIHFLIKCRRRRLHHHTP